MLADILVLALCLVEKCVASTLSTLQSASPTSLGQTSYACLKGAACGSLKIQDAENRHLGTIA